MTEKKIATKFQGASIEGLLHRAPGDRAAVVTHPHPLYGGDMYNNVVATIVAAYREAKYSTFRFNFRGIGQNAASYDQAIGGQADVRAAIARVRNVGKTTVDLAGYSFGAWINAIGLESFDPVNRLIMVSPPVDLLDFSPLKPSEKIQLVITGANDPMAPAAKIEKLIPTWNPRARFEVVAGADHFFLGKTEVIRDIIRDFLKN